MGGEFGLKSLVLGIYCSRAFSRSQSRQLCGAVGLYLTGALLRSLIIIVYIHQMIRNDTRNWIDEYLSNTYAAIMMMVKETLKM